MLSLILTALLTMISSEADMESWTLCIGLGIMFCQVQEAPKPVSDSYCEISKPIYWSASDTRQTKEQVDTHNRIWKSLCQKDKVK